MQSAVHSRCVDCVQRPDRFFCDMSPAALQAFDGIKTVVSYPRGTVLFEQGQAGRSVFLLCEGRARLTVCSETGKRLTLQIAGPGDLLGLSANLSGGSYEVRAEAMDNLKVALVKQKDLLQFLHEHREACLHVVHLLSQDLHIAYDRVRAVGLGRSRRARFHLH